MKQILLAVQDLMINPNPNSPAQREAYDAYVKDRAGYNRKILEQARSNIPDV